MQARKESLAAYSALRAHSGTECYRDVIAWIDNVFAQQQRYMIDCPREKLADAQVRLRQLKALRDALVEPGGAFTGFVLD